MFVGDSMPNSWGMCNLDIYKLLFEAPYLASLDFFWVAPQTMRHWAVEYSRKRYGQNWLNICVFIHLTEMKQTSPNWKVRSSAQHEDPFHFCACQNGGTPTPIGVPDGNTHTHTSRNELPGIPMSRNPRLGVAYGWTGGRPLRFISHTSLWSQRLPLKRGSAWDINFAWASMTAVWCFWTWKALQNPMVYYFNRNFRIL